MEDYSNSNKSKEKPKDKEIKKVIQGEAAIQQKTLGRKAKSIVVNADFKGLAKHVVLNVLFPDIRNMIFDAGHEAWRRLIFPSGSRRGGRIGPSGSMHISYNNSVNRMLQDPRELVPGPMAASQNTNARASRQDTENFLVPTREDAIAVLDMMNAIIDTYDGVASLHDLKELLGLQADHVDQRWGWTGVLDADIRQTREGCVMSFPPVSPISSIN